MTDKIVVMENATPDNDEFDAGLLSSILLPVQTLT